MAVDETVRVAQKDTSENMEMMSEWSEEFMKGQKIGINGLNVIKNKGRASARANVRKKRKRRR